MADDFTANISTTGSVLVGGLPVQGNIEATGDHDWFKVWLWAGNTYVIKGLVNGNNGSLTLVDSILALHNSSGTQVAFNDDGSNAGNGSYLRYVAPTSGYYFINMGDFGENNTGTYQVQVEQQADSLSAPHLAGTGTTSADRLGDFFYDGRDDLIQISANGNIYIAESKADGSGFAAFHQAGAGATVNDQFGNFDNNLGSDLLQIFNGRAYVASYNQGTGQFGAFNQWAASGVQANATHVDVTLDNRDDLFQILADGRVQVGVSIGTGFSAFVTSNIGATVNDQISDGHSEFNAGVPDVNRSDFNGDGVADLLQLFNGRAYVALSNFAGGFGAFTQWSSGGGSASDRFGDFNGDGRADLYQYFNGTAYVALSNGSSFGSFQVFATGASASDQITDMNGDNRADLYQVFQGRAYVALSNGNPGANNTVGSSGYEIWSSGVSANDRLGDTNADGLTDIVHVDNSGATVIESLHVSGGNAHLYIL